MAKTIITIEAIINADVSKVWNYFNEPEHITKWNSASDDWHCPYASNDLRIGGKLNYRMEAKDGSFAFDFEAIYDEVITHKILSYILLDGRHVINRLEELCGLTKVTTTFNAEQQNSVDLQRNGWQVILNNFKEYVELNLAAELI